VADADCSHTVVPHVELPAYSTIIGATFYPSSMSGAHVFPSAYRGGLFLTAHGGAHTDADGGFSTPPRVVYVPMNGDTPVTPVNWGDPTKQWTDFVTGCQLADGVTRVARPSGITVGRDGSLFLADDLNSTVVRIRPM
jgi:glucose/arabinose dehydrogenase